ncbi:THUMP domain-containing class I SAM-dependent RNA methyltransferase [Tuwongella immobilis]|uniref:THUMP domain-containing protein n=1 Tax=Tuwongella immobilis TaxID=692036 RepID=A0A6C2YU26_9BACT|nr:THUMP domain-containing protein [Tuwongella immobilis]VIP04539.1 rna methyltransferase : Putative RNA methylase OS=Geobacter uraniireducens (strain Rf4) GN=Gura_3994 PE=4 SV=1: THUMP: UPF0020 [Tuwongella immobilis]VTS06439.1 rna methyltransferase : Putative RNA methylase OS=Geobacter uraniireducens (strain Rf4) GN=Gura_3994 PE=4 SV=1: THUMP: UPF0020 [Tuwongella immobilis]
MASRYFATCARGLERFLAQELTALGADSVEPGRGGVRFQGDRRMLYRANLELRTAIRVLEPILEADVASPDELYEAIRTLDWQQWITPSQTLAVDCNVRDSQITHSQYAARRVKDAICDQLREKLGKRPSVDTERPSVGLNLHIFRDHATLSLDSSGDSLHKRGYRPELLRAPINEALAAGLLMASGWQPGMPLADPMCGSGTFLIEAAWMALNRPPGLTRRHFGFMGWLDFDRGEWANLRDEARRKVAKTLPVPMVGSDIRGDAIESAVANARAAGIGHLLTFEKADVRDFFPPNLPPGIAPGMVLVNPPYGERLGETEELVPLYRILGEVITDQCPGWRFGVFTSNRVLAKAIRVKPAQRLPFFNGALECELLMFGP